MEKRKILIQLDTDTHPSVFDRVVAIDAGVDELFSYGGVKPEQVQGLVHGAIFTRGPADLKRTAIFVGGSDVSAGEKLLAEVRKHMLPQYALQVSVLLDANGANTTAAAGVRAVARHLELKDAPVLVLGGTGPVGQRVALLLARQGAKVRVGSRQLERAAQVCERLKARVPDAKLEPAAAGDPPNVKKAMEGMAAVVAAGAAGAVFIPKADWSNVPGAVKVLVDLNAVPPLGIESIDVGDKAKEREGKVCYGAIGVGGTKMKIHRAAVAKLFESNNLVLDAEEVYALGESI